MCLAISSDGRKLPPMIIFKRKNPPTNLLSKHVVVEAQTNAWITEGLMKNRLEKIWKKINLPPNIVKLLLLDHCSSHLKDSVAKTVKENGDIDFIPPGTTSLLQPLDLMINKPFKENLKALFAKWLKEKGNKRQ